MSLDKYAIVLGKGDLATAVVKEAQAKNLDFIIVGIKGFSPAAVVNSHEHFWFYMGQLQPFFNGLQNHGCNKIIFAGSITRPSFWALKLDALGKNILKQYLANVKGDDHLLSLIIKVIESKGFKVVAPQEIAPSILAPEGLYTSETIPQDIIQDIDHACAISKSLGLLDIGQSIIYQQGMVIAVEAVEGTKEMILRSKKLIKKTGPKAFLVKLKKEHQNNLIDLPTIGPKTIKQAKRTGLCGIIIEADSTIILNKPKVIELANKYSIFILSRKL